MDSYLVDSFSFRQVTTVIFDLDGTLIEHTWQLSRVCKALFSHFADDLTPVSQTEFFEVYWSKSEDMWYMMVDGVLDGAVAARYGYVNTLRTLGQDTDLAKPMLDYWIELVLHEAIPFDDTFAVLSAVNQKYRTGILTNGFINLQRRKIEKYDLASYVDFTLVSEEAGYHKPDRRAFLAALALAGEPAAAETLYIGDNLTADIEGALGAGLTPIFFDARDDKETPNGVLKITKLSELLPLLDL
jgi:putative hydrolase of the HAD superfamily